MFQRSDHTFAVCAYGKSPFLEDLLSSLAAQEVPTSTLVATSTPNRLIESLCDKYGLPLHVNHGPGGIAGDWNFTVSLAKTPLVTIAHQDDVYLPRYSRVALESLSQRPDATLHFTDYGELRDGVRVDDNRLLAIKHMLLTPLKSRALSRYAFVRRRALSCGCPICCPSVTLVRGAFSEPLFNNHFGANLDWETWERLSLVPGSFVYAPEILMLHRIHEESETSHLIQDNRRTQEDLEMLCRFWPRPLARTINRVYSTGQKSNQVG